MLRPIVTSTALHKRALAISSVAALVLTVISLLSVGVPATLLLGGGWLLAAALGRVPGLDGPVSWAASVVATVALVSGVSAAVAVVSPHNHGRLINLAVLAVPAVVGAAGCLLALLRARHEPVAAGRRPSRAALAAVVTGGVLVAPMWIAGRGQNFGIAWAASGDARNHVLLLRQVSSLGGITLDRLRTYPAVIDNVSGLLASAGRRGGLPPGQLMVHDLHAVAATYVISCVAIAVLMMAALLELLPTSRVLGRLGAPVVIVLLAAAFLSATGLVLGTTLLDGYLSAFGTVPLALASVVLALRCSADPSPSALTLLSVAAILVFFSWTLLAVLPATLILVIAGVLLMRLRRWRRHDSPDRSPRSRLWWAAAVVTAGTLLILTGAVLTHLSTLRNQLKDPGSVTHPQPLILVGIALLAAALATSASTSTLRLQLLLPLAAALTGAGLVQVVIWLSDNGRSWTYYSGKLLYLLACSLAWLVFAPLLFALTKEHTLPPRPRGSEVIFASTASLATLVVVAWATTVASPWDKAAHGWKQPTARVMTDTVRLADKGQPFVLWQWTNGADDRLGNFWAALAWGYSDQFEPKYGATLFGGPEYWAYSERGQMHDLCTAAKGVNGLYIYTHNASLQAAMNAQCPNLGQHIVVERRPT